MATGFVSSSSLRQDAVYKGSHGSDGGVFARRITDMLSPEGKVCRKQGNALRLATTIYLSHNQFGLTSRMKCSVTCSHPAWPRVRVRCSSRRFDWPTAKRREAWTLSCLCLSVSVSFLLPSMFRTVPWRRSVLLTRRGT